MALPSAYLTRTKNTDAIFEALQKAAVPDRFTFEFLKNLGFGSSADRPTIPVLKALGFLSDSGAPTDRYRRYKDPALARAVLGEGIREAYSDLFAIDADVGSMSSTELVGLFGRLSDKGEAVNRKMASTFVSLVKLADLGTASIAAPLEVAPAQPSDGGEDPKPPSGQPALSLRHDIHVHLPASTDAKVYQAIFAALREELG